MVVSVGISRAPDIRQAGQIRSVESAGIGASQRRHKLVLFVFMSQVPDGVRFYLHQTLRPCKIHLSPELVDGMLPFRYGNCVTMCLACFRGGFLDLFRPGVKEFIHLIF